MSRFLRELQNGDRPHATTLLWEQRRAPLVEPHHQRVEAFLALSEFCRRRTRELTTGHVLAPAENRDRQILIVRCIEIDRQRLWIERREALGNVSDLGVRQSDTRRCSEALLLVAGQRCESILDAQKGAVRAF